MDNAERVRRSVGVWNEQGLEALARDWWAQDIVWHDLPELPDAVTSRGRQAVFARLQELVDAAGHWQFDIKSIEEHGDVTLTELVLIGSGVQSGAAFTGTIHQLIRWRDGLTAEVISHSSRKQALDALGQLSNAR